MRDYLIFRLAGPMASWGDIAVGEIRSSWIEPSKSAVLGLIAAALGIRREEEDRHAVLHRDLGFAVRVDGTDKRALRDYHTVQAPSVGKGLRWPTRADEVADKERLNTVLSTRWYWQDFAATIALWTRELEEVPLPDICSALKRPRFALYLGRKSCPLGHPIGPRIASAASVEAAMCSYDTDTHSAQVSDDLAPGKEIFRDKEPQETEVFRMRRDTVRRRRGWTFSDRAEVRNEIKDMGDAQ